MQTITEIIKSTTLFSHLTQTELESLVKSSDLVELPAGWVIIREGDLGEDLYVVIEGSLEVFTAGQDGPEITLESCKVGDYVGEQALLPGARKTRSASVRTAEPSMVLAIHKQDFLKTLDTNDTLKQQLLSIGVEQIKAKMIKQSVLFRAIQVDSPQEWAVEKTYADGKVIFSQGDEADFYYVIVDGKVELLKENDDGQWSLLAQLDAGQGFGELGLLKRTRRMATAIARGKLVVRRIDGNVFRDMYLHNPELRDYIQTLSKVYFLGGYGLVTQHTGRFMNQSSIVTIYYMDDGRTVVCSHVIGCDIVDIHLKSTHEQGIRKLHYHSSTTNLDLELRLDGNLIVGLTSYDVWDEVGEIQNMIVKQIPITAEQLELFRETGHLRPEEKIICADTDIVCSCLQVDYGSILDVTKQGANTVEDISDPLGCGTVCGACLPQIREILGENGWLPIVVTEEFEVVPNIRSFRFEPFGGALPEAKPGQHLTIKAPIDGKWVLRPYTITSAAHQTNYREVTIKREPYGYFSNWIFDKHDQGTVLQISEPQGDYFVDIEDTDPVVCFVAGIGMTPALSILRTFVGQEQDRTLYIDYSAREENAFIYREDIQSMVDTNEHFAVKFRATSQTGHINRQDVADIIGSYANAQVYICGPKSFENAVKEYLLASGVPADRIHIEEFVPVGRNPDDTKSYSPLSNNFYIVIGGLLLLLFLLQYTFQIKWAWLESMQADETFKRWSGLVLVIFILFQWYYPVLRWRGLYKAAAHFRKWHLLIGALAPAVYFLHSTVLGYAYTFLLAIIYFGNFIAGLLNQDIIPESRYRKSYGNYWLAVHIILSISMISLILYHIFIVFAFKESAS